MKKLATTIMALGMLSAGLHQAAAAPTMRLSADGGVTWTNIVDNGPADADPTPGFVTFIGPVGGWTVSIASGFGSPLIGDPLNPQMDVGTQAQSADAQSLIVQMSDTGYTPFPNQTFIGVITLNTGGSVTYNVYRDTNNVLFGTTESYSGGLAGTSPSPTASLLIGEGPFINTFNGGSNSVVVANGGNSPYSLTSETIIVHTGPARTQTDAFLQTLPPPACNCTLSFNSPASITNCVGDAIPEVVASQDCGNGPVSAPVTFAGAVTNGVCPQIITRTNTATDNCGNLHTFVQTITVNCKPDCTLTSSVPTAVAGTGGLNAWVADAGPGANYFWTISNGSITNGQGTTNITFVAGADATKPVSICVSVSTASGCITKCCLDIPLTPPCNCVVLFNSPAKLTNCASDAIPAVTASENCGNGWVSVPVTIVSLTTNGVCPKIITRTATAMDDCGKVSTLVQTITVNCLPDCTITPSVTIAVVGGSNYTASVASAGPGATYLWTVLNGTITGGQGTANLTWSAGADTNSPITIGITITAATGCQSTCSASVHLTPKPPQICLGSGDTATIGFWHNKNGQALILGAPNQPALGNWLATNFPCMFGNLAGKSNNVVAALFMTDFNVKGQKTYAQVLAGAFAVYFTSSTLAGNGAAQYGFNVTPGGTGAKVFNVGSLGTTLGLQNNTSYTVMQLLQAANSNCPFNTAVFNALNTIFDGINTTGDIN